MTKMILPDIVSGYPLDKASGFGELAFIVPEESINLITQPSFEYITTYNASNAGLNQWMADRKFGYLSCKVSKIAAGKYGIFTDFTAASSDYYSLSVYAKAAKGIRLAIQVRISPYTTIVVEKRYIANGDWQRLELTFSTIATTIYSLCVAADEGAPNYFLVDGWQLENKKKPTTFFCGHLIQMDNTKGYIWNGTEFNSSSTRFANNRDGGRIVTLAELGIFLNGIVGMGFRGIENKISPLNDGSGFFQDSIRLQRQFSVMLSVYGESYDDITRKVSRLRKCIFTASDPYRNELKMLLIKYDEYGQKAKEIEIKCYFSGVVEGEIDNMYQKKIALTFDMPNPTIAESGNYAIDLAYKSQLTVNRIAKMNDVDWSWVNMDSGFNGAVWDISQSPEGNIWVCGEFTTAGGSSAKGVAFWNGTSWNTVSAITTCTLGRTLEVAGKYMLLGGSGIQMGVSGPYYMVLINRTTLTVTGFGFGAFNGEIDDLFYDEKYNRLYVAGAFTNSGLQTQITGGAGIMSVCPFIVPPLGVQIEENMYGIPPGMGNGVLSICKGSDGYLYAGGTFAQIGQTQSGGAISALCLARWNPATSTWSNIGNTNSAVASVWCVKKGPDGNIYIGGAFTTVGGVTVNRIAKRVGSSWFSMAGGVYDSGGPGLVYDFDWKQSGDMYIVGSFDFAGGVEMPESITVWRPNYYVPATIRSTNAPIAINCVFVSRINDLYVGFSSTQTAYASEAVSFDVQEDTYPALVAYGPGHIAAVVNRSNNKSIYFDKLYLVEGEQFVIWFSPYGNSYWSNVQRDIRPYVIGGTDNGFKLSKGNNIISAYLYEGNDAGTQVYLLVKKIYDGIEAISDAAI